MNYVGIAILFSALGVGQLAADEHEIKFRKVQLDAKFRSEGVAVADFNGDGRKDISAGSVYYAAPDWRMVAIQEKPQEYQPKSYARSFQNFADDLNGDGRPDLIVVEWPGQQTVWYENPGKQIKPWPKHILAHVTNNEGPMLLDIDGDGVRELIAGHSPDPKNSDHPKRQMAIFRRTKDRNALWDVRAISAASAPSTTRYSHGLGAGDINGDGRTDIVVPQGWWEAQDAAKEKSEWRFHKAPFGGSASNMHVADFDGDGDADVLGASPHAFGIWWFEQTKDGWKQHLIDKSFSQTHSVTLADINRDGLPDFVTGKRWWAHGGRDPGADGPAVLMWYELKREKNGPKWIAHQIDHNSGVGTQHQVADVNGDGLLDVVTANKKGVYYFEQIGR